jgi:hypothetical protein
MDGITDNSVREKSRKVSESGKPIGSSGFNKQKPFKHSIVADGKNELTGKPHTNPQFNDRIKR